MVQKIRNWMKIDIILDYLNKVCLYCFYKIQRCIRQKESSLEWWSQRFMSGAALPLILVFLIVTFMNVSQEKITILSFLESMYQSFDYLIIMTTIIVGWHIQAGMCEILKDYVHREKLKIASFFMVRVLTIESMKFVYFGSLLF